MINDRKFQYHLYVSLLLLVIMTNYVSSSGNGTETQSQNGTGNVTETQSQNGTGNITETQSQTQQNGMSLACSEIRLMRESFTTFSDEEINAVTAEEFTECLSDIGQLTMWNDSQKIVLLEKAVNSLNTSVCNMTAEQVVYLGTISQALSIEDLACLPLTDNDVVSTLGGLTGWNTMKLSTLAEHYMEDNSITNLSSAIVSVATLGELVCGFQPADISTIDVSEVVDSSIQLGRLEDCSEEQYTAIKNLVVDPAAYGRVETWSAAEVTELKNILVGLTTEDIQNLSTNALEGLSAQVISKLPGAVLAAMTDEQLGSLMSSQIALLTDAQKQQMSTAQTTLLNNITPGTVNANTTGTVNTNATETVTINTPVSLACSDIRLIGESFTTFSDEEINAVTAEEFTECLSDIAQLTMWNDGQKIVLLEKAVNSLSTSVCNMTAEQVVQLGTIAQALSIEDLACLPLTDNDVVSALGGLTGWNTVKLSTLAEHYMKDNNITDLSSAIVSVTTLGELVCGFHPADISTIDVSEIVDSIIQLGRLEDCSEEQYTAIKNLVVDPAAYGRVETWAAADVTELKNILVGLTTEDIQKLSTNALEGLSAQVISKLPRAVLAAMTDEQLGSLMSSQIALITYAQKQQMSTAQRTLLNNITPGTVSANITDTPSAITTDTPSAITTDTPSAITTDTPNAITTKTANVKTPAEAIGSRAGAVVSTVEWILSLAVVLILLES